MHLLFALLDDFQFQQYDWEERTDKTLLQKLSLYKYKSPLEVEKIFSWQNRTDLDWREVFFCIERWRHWVSKRCHWTRPTPWSLQTLLPSSRSDLLYLQQSPLCVGHKAIICLWVKTISMHLEGFWHSVACLVFIVRVLLSDNGFEINLTC